MANHRKVERAEEGGFLLLVKKKLGGAVWRAQGGDGFPLAECGKFS